MFDPDAGHRHPLRLGVVIDPDQDLANAYREMTEATMRWIDARMRVEAIRAQSQPIPASAPVLSTDNDFWTHRHRAEAHAAGPHPLVFRTTGHAERLGSAARGQIGNAADDMRAERLAHALNTPAATGCLDAPLFEDDGA